MKIIALIPYKNEERFLPTFFSGIRNCVDEIVAIDDQSTDRSTEIMEAAGASVYRNEIAVEAGWAELGIRERLLRWGREHGGTYFVVLDADETFTGQFADHIERVCCDLKPGRKVKMQWLAMWKSVDHYRDDRSIWSRKFKDFIFHDDGRMTYPQVWMHRPRTPRRPDGESAITLGPDVGAVFHFQFSDWEDFQIKQAWYRCSELKRNNWTGIETINRRYRLTRDDPNASVVAAPEAWKRGIVFPEVGSFRQAESWRLDQISAWFEAYGVERFEPLEIWHMPQVRELAHAPLGGCIETEHS